MLPGAEQGWRLRWRCCFWRRRSMPTPRSPSRPSTGRRTPKLRHRKPSRRTRLLGRKSLTILFSRNSSSRTACACCLPRITSAPTYSIGVTYNVGSRDERPGRTGFAHLFEHMLFQGSENVGKGEHFILIQNNGGSANGTTNTDRTNYFETLPANQLELGIFLEADRMRAPAITQANFDNQRADRAGGAAAELRQPPVRQDLRSGHRYWPTITFPTNIRPSAPWTISTRRHWTMPTAFFRTYYAPNNAVLSLVGDFKTRTLRLALIKKYFENIPAQPPPAPPDVSEPEQKAERRKTLEDGFAQTPRLDIVLQNSAGQYAGLVRAGSARADVLSSGVSSRLYQKFVKEKELALSVYGRRGGTARAVAVLV